MLMCQRSKRVKQLSEERAFLTRGTGSAKALSWEHGSVFKEYQVIAQWLKENEGRERDESSGRYIGVTGLRLHRASRPL